MLIQPDSLWQIIMEVNTSDSGVGAVLPQCSVPDQKLHPRSFFSRRLSHLVSNYDVRNCELLSMKLVLGEWRHWLEGAEQPFIIWTDHKNLAYI